MSGKFPSVTPALVWLTMNVAKEKRYDFHLCAMSVANFTDSDAEFWNELRIKGSGPEVVKIDGFDFYRLGDLLDWVMKNVCDDAEASND